MRYVDAAPALLYSPRMAKKLSGAKTSAPAPGRADLPVSQGEGEVAQQHRPTKTKRPDEMVSSGLLNFSDAERKTRYGFQIMSATVLPAGMNGMT